MCCEGVRGAGGREGTDAEDECQQDPTTCFLISNSHEETAEQRDHRRVNGKGEKKAAPPNSFITINAWQRRGKLLKWKKKKSRIL